MVQWRALLLWLRDTVTNGMWKVRVVELEVYAILYQVRKTRHLHSTIEPWFPVIPSFLSESQSMFTLKGRHFYVWVIYNSSKGSVNFVLNL